jgi:hypothetical protein
MGLKTDDHSDSTSLFNGWMGEEVSASATSSVDDVGSILSIRAWLIEGCGQDRVEHDFITVRSIELNGRSSLRLRQSHILVALLFFHDQYDWSMHFLF